MMHRHVTDRTRAIQVGWILLFSTAPAEGANDTQRIDKRLTKGGKQAYWRLGETLEHHTNSHLLSC